MTTDSSAPPSLFAALKRTGSVALSMAATRLTLASLELAEEKDRLVGVALLGAAGALFAFVALLALSALVVLLCWDVWRWQSLAALTVVYAGIGAACLLRARSVLRNAPPLLSATLAELDKDRQLFE